MSLVGEYLKELRSRRGMTTRQLGEAVGCSGSHITFLEKGRRRVSLRLLPRIVEALQGDFLYALGLYCLDQGVPEEMVSGILVHSSPAMGAAISSGTPKSAQRAAKA